MSTNTLINQDALKKFSDQVCLSLGAEKAIEDLIENLEGNFISSEQLGIAAVFDRALRFYYETPKDARGPLALAEAVTSAARQLEAEYSI